MGTRILILLALLSVSATVVAADLPHRAGRECAKLARHLATFIENQRELTPCDCCPPSERQSPCESRPSEPEGDPACCVAPVATTPCGA